MWISRPQRSKGLQDDAARGPLRHSFASSTEDFAEIPLMFLKLPLEPLKKGEGIRGGSGKTGQNFVTEQTPRFPRGMFHHVFTHRDLTVGSDHDFIVAAYT